MEIGYITTVDAHEQRLLEITMGETRHPVWVEKWSA